MSQYTVVLNLPPRLVLDGIFIPLDAIESIETIAEATSCVTEEDALALLFACNGSVDMEFHSLTKMPERESIVAIHAMPLGPLRVKRLGNP